MRGRTLRRWGWPVLLVLVVALGAAVWREVHTSHWQARWTTRYAATLGHEVAPGPSDRYPLPGAWPVR